MKKTLAIALCLSLLTGCAGAPKQTQPATVATEETAAPTTQTTQAPTVPATETTEPMVLYRHPLTGELVDAPVKTQPVAVVINNISQAQPLHGIGAADVLCEIMAEGGGSITRLLAVYTDLEQAEKIGSIRSARTYMVDLARAFGTAPLVHCGYSDYARQEINKTKYPSFNQSFQAEYFYRDKDREKAGYATEHTLFASGARLLEGLKEKGYDLLVEDGLDLNLRFEEQVRLDGQEANKISFRFYSKGGKQTVLTYDREADAYFGTQVWKNKTSELKDANSGQAVPFRNVLLLHAKTTTDGYRMFAQLTGEGTGYFACGGTIVPIKWHREDSAKPFSYTLEDGTPITLAVGKTYMGILPTGSPEMTVE